MKYSRIGHPIENHSIEKKHSLSLLYFKISWFSSRESFFDIESRGSFDWAGVQTISKDFNK